MICYMLYIYSTYVYNWVKYCNHIILCPYWIYHQLPSELGEVFPLYLKIYHINHVIYYVYVTICCN